MVLVIFITRFLAFFLQNTHTVQSNAFKVLHTSLSLLFMVDPVRSLSSASYRKSGSMSNGWNCQYWWNPLKAVVGKSSRQLPPPWKSGLQRLVEQRKGVGSGEKNWNWNKYGKLNKNRLELFLLHSVSTCFWWDFPPSLYACRHEGKTSKCKCTNLDELLPHAKLWPHQGKHRSPKFLGCPKCIKHNSVLLPSFVGSIIASKLLSCT